MYSANIKSKKMTEGNVCIVVEYTSATDSFTETYDMRTSFNLDQRIKARLSELDELSAMKNDLNLGIISQAEYDTLLSELKALKAKL